MRHPQNDKLLHFFYGTLISLGALFVMPAYMAFILVCFVALTKELYDEYAKPQGRFDWVDITYTVSSGFILLIQSFI